MTSLKKGTQPRLEKLRIAEAEDGNEWEVRSVTSEEDEEAYHATLSMFEK